MPPWPALHGIKGNDIFCCKVYRLRAKEEPQSEEENFLDEFLENRLENPIPPRRVPRKILKESILRYTYAVALFLWEETDETLHAQEYFIPHCNYHDVAVELEEQMVLDLGYKYTDTILEYTCPCHRGRCFELTLLVRGEEDTAEETEPMAEPTSTTKETDGQFTTPPSVNKEADGDGDADDSTTNLMERTIKKEPSEEPVVKRRRQMVIRLKPAEEGPE